MNQTVEMYVFDLPGKESFMGLNRMYLRDTNAALIVYDKTNKQSLESVEKWIYEIKNTGPSGVLIFLCANKLDSQKAELT